MTIPPPGSVPWCIATPCPKLDSLSSQGKVAWPIMFVENWHVYIFSVVAGEIPRVSLMETRSFLHWLNQKSFSVLSTERWKNEKGELSHGGLNLSCFGLWNQLMFRTRTRVQCTRKKHREHKDGYEQERARTRARTGTWAPARTRARTQARIRARTHKHEPEHNLVPRVLSLLRESTLVTAGHVSKHANPSRTEGGSST